jgi:hypothetical protein
MSNAEAVPTSKAEEVPTSKPEGVPTLRFWEHTALWALFLEVIGLGIYAGAFWDITTFGILFLLSLAATGGGGIVGFVFGVPRYRTSAHVDGTFQYNSNLEQVSDWLTKIIIGATLVEIDSIAGAIGRVSLFIGGEIGHVGGATVACSAIVFSFVGGFMWAYLWVSLRLIEQWKATEPPRDEKKVRAAENKAGGDGTSRPVGKPAGKSEAPPLAGARPA